MASQLPNKVLAGTPLTLPNSDHPNNEHILLCLVLRTVLASCQTITVLVIPKGQGHSSERAEEETCYVVTPSQLP